MEPISQEYENYAVGKYDGEEDEDGVEGLIPCGILSGVEKVHFYCTMTTIIY